MNYHIRCFFYQSFIIRNEKYYVLPVIYYFFKDFQRIDIYII